MDLEDKFKLKISQSKSEHTVTVLEIKRNINDLHEIHDPLNSEIKRKTLYTYKIEPGPNHDDTGSILFHSLSLIKFMKSFLVLGP